MIKRQSTQAIDNYDNFHQTIMNLEPSQIEDSVCQTPQATNHYGASTEETRSQCFTCRRIAPPPTLQLDS